MARRDDAGAVVEDEKRLAAGLRSGLEAEGFAVDVALNGTDGLWMARENPCDAIALDSMLPGVHGYRICATLRDKSVWTPILMLTAKEGVRDEVQGWTPTVNAHGGSVVIAGSRLGGARIEVVIPSGGGWDGWAGPLGLGRHR